MLILTNIGYSMINRCQAFTNEAFMISLLRSKALFSAYL
ncbi:MAG: hypothetical protein BWY89_00285 [Bacteroidetes bacterium ADurb.BinA012]|jgi:hypothetical protein|nr:MAG: hypothetical protein BWY89_00285 [Bacteroidetes bacterium ADurb.BinA012]